MAGFLDKKDRIVDMILTDEGKRLLAAGSLDFAFFAFFDDEVNYSPYIAGSGSMTPAELSSSIEQQIQADLVMEAVVGRSFPGHSSDGMNVNRPLYTMPQGQVTIPRVSLDPTVASGSISVSQRKIQGQLVSRDAAGVVHPLEKPFDIGYERTDSSLFSLDLGVDDYFGEFQQEGFLVRICASGSDGLIESPVRRDEDGTLSYSNDMRLIVDDEVRRREARLLEKSQQEAIVDLSSIRKAGL